jgi:Na+-driven multidrug efflux pump
MGSKEIEKSEQSIKESLGIAEYIMGTMGIIFILFPKFILLLFTSDPEIIQLGVWGLRLIGFLQFVDADLLYTFFSFNWGWKHFISSTGRVFTYMGLYAPS